MLIQTHRYICVDGHLGTRGGAANRAGKTAPIPHKEQSNPHRLSRQQRRSPYQQRGLQRHHPLAGNQVLLQEGWKYISHTEWHRCVVFGKLSEFAKTLTKGAHIQVEGELRSREYDSKKTDSKRRVWEIRVASI